MTRRNGQSLSMFERTDYAARTGRVTTADGERFLEALPLAYSQSSTVDVRRLDDVS